MEDNSSKKRKNGEAAKGENSLKVRTLLFTVSHHKSPDSPKVYAPLNTT